jgi:hypothetical protein
MDNTNTQKFDQWALIELFGHQRIVGKVTEATIGGCAFLRVDVPASETESAYTKYYGNGAIYSMTPIAENIAMGLLERIRPRPMSVYDLPQLSNRRDDGEDDDDDSVF